MPRITKNDAKKREEFMLETFKKEPNLSVAKANKKLEEKFGSQMRAQRAYELRAIAQKESNGKPTGTATAARRANRKRTATAHRNANAQTPVPPPAIVTENKNRLVVLEGSGENIRFLKGAIDTLNSAGLGPKLNVDIANDKYAVVRA